MAISTFGTDNFGQIKAVTDQGLVYHSRPEIEVMLADAGYEVCEIVEYADDLFFDSPLDVLRHIKATGVNSIGKTVWTKRRLEDFEARYRELFALPSGGVPLTYHPILVTARYM